MLDITHYLPQRRRKTQQGWISVNAPCCAHRGESADRRQRGGIKITPQGWTWNCFNCGFTASFVLGRALTFRARQLLSWLSVPQEEIERLSFESLRQRGMQGILEDRQRTVNAMQGITFEDRDLPEDFAVIDENFPTHWRYLRDRCVPEDYPMGAIIGSPDDKFTRRPGVIIPFVYDGRIVGHARRYFDDRNPRYIHDMQPGFVFGTDLQRPHWQHVIVVEGVFDALSSSALAVLHADVSDVQARLIRGLDRAVTVVPDQDLAGLKLVDRALELGWAVSMPDWPRDVKDVNDAVRRWGRTATLLQIFQARETSRIKIELGKKRLANQL